MAFKIYKDDKYSFVYMFDKDNGNYIRTGIIKNGKDTGVDPFMASFPHLIDIGIMSFCHHGMSGLCQEAGIECYQSAPIKGVGKNMSIEDYEWICKQMKGRSTQVALGGAGDPDMHENFEDILRITSKYDMVPNFTTSGLGMTPEKAELCKKYCGAVAVSEYSRLTSFTPSLVVRKRNEEKKVSYESFDDIPRRFTFGNIYNDCRKEGSKYYINDLEFEKYQSLSDELNDNILNGEFELYYVYDESDVERHKVKANYTMNAFKMLKDAEVRTNFHFVVGNQSIDEAIIRLKYNGFPKGTNAVIFLLHKPVGLGRQENVLKSGDPRVKEFYELLSAPHPFKVGVDSCNVPGIVNFGKNINPDSLDTCEGARYSCYISSNMIMVPCSFDQQYKYECNLKEMTIEEAWNSDKFNEFRNIFKRACPNCSMKDYCLGGCPLEPEIVVCPNKH